MHGDGAGTGGTGPWETRSDGAPAGGAQPDGARPDGLWPGGARPDGPQPGGAHPAGPSRGRTHRAFLHEFRPGKAVAGLVLLGIAAVYLGDAGGLWRTPPPAALPMLAAGLVLAGIASTIGYGIRRRSARRASTESSGDPASRSGSQAMR